MGLKDQLNGVLPDFAVSRLPDHFEVVGKVAVLSLSEETAEYGTAIADAILKKRRSLRTVLNKTSMLGGSYRTAHYEILAGKDTTTTHREYGFSYSLDVLAVFFNSRLATERKRVTDIVRSGERVYVPFCGVGPFVIPAAARGARVVAVEKNPEAFRWLKKNTGQNHVDENTTMICGDAFETTWFDADLFDRAIIPTPYGRDKILAVVTPLVKPGGTIHFYTFKNREQAADLPAIFEQDGLHVRNMRRCGHVAPGISRWVFDLQKEYG
jgi:tRNA (guanine37-N1)-methyltransferase